MRKGHFHITWHFWEFKISRFISIITMLWLILSYYKNVWEHFFIVYLLLNFDWFYLAEKLLHLLRYISTNELFYLQFIHLALLNGRLEIKVNAIEPFYINPKSPELHEFYNFFFTFQWICKQIYMVWYS